MKDDFFPCADLREIGKRYGTPSFVYFLEPMKRRCLEIKQLFQERLKISFAVKSNPNTALLAELKESFDYLDISSIAEGVWARKAGYEMGDCSFTGPAKRRFELL